jgi:hypothetical protein
MFPLFGIELTVVALSIQSSCRYVIEVTVFIVKMPFFALSTRTRQRSFDCT